MKEWARGQEAVMKSKRVRKQRVMRTKGKCEGQARGGRGVGEQGRGRVQRAVQGRE